MSDPPQENRPSWSCMRRLATQGNSWGSASSPPVILVVITGCLTPQLQLSLPDTVMNNNNNNHRVGILIRSAVTWVLSKYSITCFTAVYKQDQTVSYLAQDSDRDLCKSSWHQSCLPTLCTLPNLGLNLAWLPACMFLLLSLLINTLFATGPLKLSKIQIF